MVVADPHNVPLAGRPAYEAIAGESAVASGRVLLSMKTYLGDAVMAVPTLDALDAAGWETTLLTAPLAAKALGRARAVPYEKNRWPWQVAA